MNGLPLRQPDDQEFIIVFMKFRFCSGFFLLIMQLAVADPVNPYDYDEVALKVFWNELYDGHGWTLYCGLRLASIPSLTISGMTVSIEHIYTSNRMVQALGCHSRQQCYENNPDFRIMESDLHNLYPVWIDASNALYDSEYGIIEGEYWRFENCDLERKKGVVEPRPVARGNIARAIFYMHNTYNLPVPEQTIEILKTWNLADPPSKQEIRRNEKIQKLQGRRNPYIDKPSLVKTLK